MNLRAWAWMQISTFGSSCPCQKSERLVQCSICWEHHVIWFILRSLGRQQLKSHAVLLDWSCTLHPSCINFRKVQRGNWWPRSAMKQTSWGLMLPDPMDFLDPYFWVAAKPLSLKIPVPICPIKEMLWFWTVGQVPVFAFSPRLTLRTVKAYSQLITV